MAWSLSEIYVHESGGSIWQGGYYSIPVTGFDSVYYCAAECEPPPDRDGNLTLNYPQNYFAPNVDSENLAFRDAMLYAGKITARSIALQVKQGQKVLVTCHAGANRSGLAVGIALRRLKVGGQEAVELIKEKRPGALSNELFCKMIREY